MKRLLTSLLLAGALLTAWAADTNKTSTELILGPYLQALSPSETVVHWQTDLPSLGWLEYGLTRELGRKADSVELGLVRANTRQHRVTLSSLRPGATYFYRICAKPILSFGAYKVVFGQDYASEIKSFKTLPGAEQPVRAILFNDLHSREATFEAVLKPVAAMDHDLSIFNGDCISDPATENQALAALASFTQGVRAESRPALFIRGNHETRGAYARELPNLFSWPQDKPFFAFSAGPVRFLVLDCGEDKPDDHPEYSGLVNFTSFREEQTHWLKQELASREFRQAKWRVLLVHIPLYPTRPKGGYSQPSHELWAPLLSKARIDLGLSAHLHKASFHPQDTANNPFPFYIGGGNRVEDSTVMILQADARSLELKVLNHSGSEVLPAFSKRK